MGTWLRNAGKGITFSRFQRKTTRQGGFSIDIIPTPLTPEQVRFLGKFLRKDDGSYLEEFPPALAEYFDNTMCGLWVMKCFLFALLPGFPRHLREQFNAYLAPHGLSLDTPPSAEEMRRVQLQ